MVAGIIKELGSGLARKQCGVRRLESLAGSCVNLGEVVAGKRGGGSTALRVENRLGGLVNQELLGRAATVSVWRSLVAAYRMLARRASGSL
jgi:hypothetical protein